MTRETYVPQETNQIHSDEPEHKKQWQGIKNI